MNFRLKMKIHLVFLTVSLGLLTSCQDKGLLSLNDLSAVTGKVEPFSGVGGTGLGAASFCSTAVVQLHSVTQSGEVVFPPVAEANIQEDGSYTLSGIRGTELGIQSDFVSSAYFLKAAGCGKIYARLLTKGKQQKITYGSSLLAFVVTSTSSAAAYEALVESRGKGVEELISLLDSQPSVEDAFTFLTTNLGAKQKFVSLFGFDPSGLTEAAPLVFVKDFPSVFKEGETHNLNAIIYHWNPSYTSQVIWKKDTVDLGAGETLVYVPAANDQGLNYIYSLYVGQESGGGIDFTKPFFARSYNRNIENIIPPTVPTVSLASSPYTSNPNISLQMDTGASLENCESFSSIAIVEGSFLAPDPAEFAAQSLSCTDDPNQILSYTLLDQSEGTKHFRVWVKDASGNISSSPEYVSLVLDNDAPVLAFVSPAANTKAQTGLTITGTCDVAFPVDIGGLGVASSSQVACNLGSFSASITFSSGDGAKDVTISQTDGASNTISEIRTFVKDTAAPVLSFTSPAASTEAQSGVTIEGSCEAGLTINLSGVGLSSPATTSCAAGTFSQAITFTTGEGPKNIIVSQTDSAGNTGSANRSFVRDNTSPNLTITSPAADTEAQSSLTLTGSCEVGRQIYFSGSGILEDLDIACASGTYSQTIFFSDGEGNKAITLTQTDASGNQTAVSRNFIRDNTNPVITQTLRTSPYYTNTNQVSFGGACETGLTMTVKRGGVAENTTSCTSGTWSYTVSSQVTDATRTYSFEQTDSSGNLGSTSAQWIRDTVDPSLTITSSDHLLTATDSVTFSGTCESGLPAIQVKLDGTNESTATCSSGNWSYTVATQTTDATRGYEFVLTDYAGNATTKSATWERNTQFPNLYIATTSPLVNNEDSATIEGDCEPGLNIEIRRDGTLENTISCASGTFSYTVATQATDGSRVYQLRQTNAVPLTTNQSITWLRDTVAPGFTLTQMKINNDDASTGNSYVSLALNTTDSASNITELCFRTDDVTAPLEDDSCWLSVESPSIGESASPNVTLTDYKYNLPIVPGTYVVYVWAKDQAGNISILTNAGLGTLNQDKDEIQYILPSPPVVDNVLIASTDTPSDPLTQTDLTVSAGQPVFIKWKVSDDQSFLSGAVSLYFTTNDSTYTLIEADLDDAANGACTIDHASTTADDGMSGCYKWASAPTGGYFRVRVVVKDQEELTAGALTSGMNVSSRIRLLAGNTDPGMNLSAKSAVFFSYTNGDLYYSDGGTLAVTRDGVVFIRDSSVGLVRIDPQDGLKKVYLRVTGTSSGDNGPVSSATAKFIDRIALDHTQPTQRLWVWDNDRIRRIDLATNTITTVIGPGTDNSDTVADPTQAKIESTAANLHWLGAGAFFASQNGDFYFQTANDKEDAQPSYKRVRVLRASTGQIESFRVQSISHARGLPDDNYNGCRIQNGIGFLMNSSGQVLERLAMIRRWSAFSGCDGTNDNRFVHFDENGDSLPSPPQGPGNIAPWYLSQGRYVQGMDGKLYFFGKGANTSAIWRYEGYSTGTWTKLLGKQVNGMCPDGTSKLSCATSLESVFVSENGTIYFLDNGAIRTIAPDDTVVTLFGQSLVSETGAALSTARLGTDLRGFHLRADGGIAFSEPLSNKFFEFGRDTNLFAIAGNGESGAATVNVDALTTRTNVSANHMGYTHFGLDQATGDIYHHVGHAKILKLERASGTIGAGGQWKIWLGEGTKGWDDPTADGSSDIGFNVDCLRHYDSANYHTPQCGWIDVLALAGGVLFTHLSRYEYRLSDSATSYRNTSIKLYQKADGVQRNLASTTGTVTGDVLCASGTPLTNCQIYSPYMYRMNPPTYDPGEDAWYFSRNSIARILKLKEGGNMVHIPTTYAVRSTAFRQKGSDKYIYYCSNFSGQLRRYHLNTSTDEALPWPINSMNCWHGSLAWDEDNSSVIFAYRQNNLMGFAEYIDP